MASSGRQRRLGGRRGRVCIGGVDRRCVARPGEASLDVAEHRQCRRVTQGNCRAALLRQRPDATAGGIDHARLGQVVACPGNLVVEARNAARGRLGLRFIADVQVGRDAVRHLGGPRRSPERLQGREDGPEVLDEARAIALTRVRHFDLM